MYTSTAHIELSYDVDIELSYDVLSPYLLCCQNISTTFIPT